MREATDAQYLKLGKALLISPKEGDDLVFDDSELLAMAKDKHNGMLSNGKYEVLMSSPLTLRRLKILMDGLPNDQKKSKLCHTIYGMIA